VEQTLFFAKSIKGFWEEFNHQIKDTGSKAFVQHISVSTLVEQLKKKYKLLFAKQVFCSKC
jgi:hypothetical protein